MYNLEEWNVCCRSKGEKNDKGIQAVRTAVSDKVGRNDPAM